MSQLRIVVATDKIYAIACSKPFAICPVNLYIADKNIAQKIVSKIGTVISRNLMLGRSYVCVLSINREHSIHIIRSNIETSHLTSYPYIFRPVFCDGEDILLLQYHSTIGIGK